MFRRIGLALLSLVSCAEFAGAAQYYFPIIAAGFLPGSTDQFYVTEFVVNNPGTQPVRGYLTFYSLEGVPLEVPMRLVPASGSPGTASDDIFEFDVPANGSWRAYTNESGTLRTGWAVLDTEDTVNPAVTFSINSRRSGLVSEAAVFEAPAATVQRMSGDAGRRASFITQLTDQTPSDTGIAIANTTGEPAAVTIRLLDSTGRLTQSTRVTLQAFASTAKFLKELFPSLTVFQGTVEILSDQPVAGLGLRFTGTVFSTIPVSVLQ